MTILTLGSRGDVEPFVALGIGLAQRGHEVTVATHEPFRPVVEQRGLRFHALPGDPQQILENPAWADWKPSVWRPWEHARLLRSSLAPLFDQVTHAHLEAACRGADAVLPAVMSASGAHGVAQELGLPCVGLNYGPHYRTRRFGQPTLFPTLGGGSLVHLLSYPPADALLGQPLREPLRPAARRRAGLPAIPSPFRTGDRQRWPPFPIVHGFSEAIVPRPDDWPSHLHVAGSWTVSRPDDEPLPDFAQAFLEAGPPPIYVSFGSIMPVGQAAAMSRRLVDVMRRAGERVIFGPGAAGLGRGLESDDVLVTDMPHPLLFPRVKAVIHHGGAGTTAVALAAGRPSFVVPWVFDQRFWGARIAAIGAGPKPLYAHQLTDDALLAAIEVLNRPDVREAAERTGARMRAEDGVGRGAELVERLAGEEDPRAGRRGVAASAA
jgi:UDP:flavonoid glycosyltransferase YjiC (YdhE family)